MNIRCVLNCVKHFFITKRNVWAAGVYSVAHRHKLIYVWETLLWQRPGDACVHALSSNQANAKEEEFDQS